MVPLCCVVFQWQNSYAINLGKKQAGYGMQSHTSAAEMDVAQPLSTDAKVHIYYVTVSPDAKVHAHYITISVDGKAHIHCVKIFISTH
jgi:hypothetical protein